MERSISFRVVGPAFYRSAVEQRLAANAHVPRAEGAQVVLLLGGAWQAEFEKLRASVPYSEGAGIILVVDRRADLLRAVQLGIQVFLDEDGGDAELQLALQAASTGLGYCSPRLMPALLRRLGTEPTAPPTEHPEGLSDLSEREREVAHLVALGWTNDRVAQELHVSIATVKFHLTRSYGKLGIQRRAQLVAILARDTQSGGAGAD